MKRLTAAQQECPYCWDGEYDMGTIYFDNGSLDVAMMSTGSPCISVMVQAEGEEPQEFQSDEIRFCPFCGRRLGGDD